MKKAPCYIVIFIRKFFARQISISILSTRTLFFLNRIKRKILRILQMNFNEYSGVISIKPSIKTISVLHMPFQHADFLYSKYSPSLCMCCVICYLSCLEKYAHNYSYGRTNVRAFIHSSLPYVVLVSHSEVTCSCVQHSVLAYVKLI